MKVLVRGRARGSVIRTAHPINFLGMIDKRTGMVGDPSHDLHGRTLAGSILVFPHGIGSSVGAYTIYSTKSYGVAPAAMICGKADLTVATGCAIANIPLVVASDQEISHLRDGGQATLDTDSGVTAG